LDLLETHKFIDYEFSDSFTAKVIENSKKHPILLFVMTVKGFSVFKMGKTKHVLRDNIINQKK